MPTVLILCAHRPGRSPSQRYRFEQYLPFLQSRGYAFTFSYLLNAKEDLAFYSAGNFLGKGLILAKNMVTRIRDLLRFRQFDIVFIQREALFLGTSFFERHAARASKMIFDFDDSIWLADTSPGNKKWEWIKTPGKFFENVAVAHTVIAGNTYLADKAKPLNKQVVVIPTTINTALHLPRPELRNKETLVIGWSGSISTVKHFELLVPVLQTIKKKYGNRVRIKVIGAPDYKNNELEVAAVAWSEATEVQELNTFDIGIMPLPDDAWAMGKCGLKGLSYMACGIPAIMSAVGVNKEIIQQGQNGLLAVTEEDWINSLSQLIEDASLRMRLGEAGRKTVEERFSVDANKELYLKVFERS